MKEKKPTSSKSKKDSPEFVIGTVKPKDGEPTRFLWFGRDFPTDKTSKLQEAENEEATGRAEEAKAVQEGATR